MKNFIENREETVSNIFKWIIYIGLVLVLITPFIKFDSFFFYFITSKAYFFRIIVEIIFFVWISLAILDKRYRPRFSLISASLILFLALIFISNIFGVNQTASFFSNFERMEGYITLIHLFALFLVAGSVLQNKKSWQILFNLSIVASFFMSIYLLMDIIKNISSGELIGRIDGPLGNPIYLAVYMLFHIFLSVYYLFNIAIKDIQSKSNNKYLWISYLPVILLNTYILFQTGTRGAMLGLIAGFVFLLLYILFFEKTKKIKIMSGSILIFLAIAISMFISYRNSDFIQSIKPLKRLATISLTEQTSEARLLNWGIAWKGVKEKPIFGWGQSNYNYVFDKYYNPAMYGNEDWFDRTHNIIFDWLIAGGFVGLIAYLLIWFSIIYLIIKTPLDKLSVIEKGVIISLLFAYFVHNFFVFDNLVSYILFFLILSYIHSLSSTPIKIFEKDFKDSVLAKIICVVCLVAIPFTVYFTNYPSYKANKEFSESIKFVRFITIANADVNNVNVTDNYEEQETATSTTKIEPYHANALKDNLLFFKKSIFRNSFGNPEIVDYMISKLSTIIQISYENSDEDKIEFIHELIKQTENLIEKDPYNSRYPHRLGLMFGQLGEYEKAEFYFKKAIEISPNKQFIRKPLITTYMLLNKQSEALTFAKETYELDESKDDMWIEYAKIASIVDRTVFNQLISTAIESGNYQKVEKLFLLGIQNNPNNIQAYVSLAALYKQIDQTDKAIEALDYVISKFPEASSEILKIKKSLIVN